MSINSEQNGDSRIPRTFKISESDLEGVIPQSIESEQNQSELRNTDPIDWNRYPQPFFSRAMKLTAAGLGGLLCLTIINDLIAMINSASEHHWIFGIAVSSVLALLVLISGMGLYQWIRGANDIDKIAGFQKSAVELQQQQNSGNVTSFTDSLVSFMLAHRRKNSSIRLSASCRIIWMTLKG